MIITYIHRIGWFVGLVLLQVLILNNVHIAGYATPFLYIYFILKFASGTSRNELMLWAFFFGLTIDIFSFPRPCYLCRYSGDECCGNRVAGLSASVIAASVYSA